MLKNYVYKFYHSVDFDCIAGGGSGDWTFGIFVIKRRKQGRFRWCVYRFVVDDQNFSNNQEHVSGICRKMQKPLKENIANSPKGAVAANSELAAQTGLEILKHGGSAADAAIGMLLTDGLCNPHSMGVGGGFLLTYYDQSSGNVDILNAREFSPSNAHCDMFKECNSLHGGLSVAVPGELRGYWELHQKYGRLPWQQLLSPVVEHCRNGVPVPKYSAGMIERSKKSIHRSPSLTAIFLNKATGKLFKEGELLKREKLAETLEKISRDGPDVLYNGALTDDFVQDVRREGGVISRRDMETYRPVWMDPEVAVLPNGLEAYSTPPPGSGCVLLFILNVLCGFDTMHKWFRLVETWKFAFGFRCQLDGPTKDSLGKFVVHPKSQSCADEVRGKISRAQRTRNDVNFYTDKCFSPYFGGGTCNVCVLAPNGDAVSVTSSINSTFGAIVASPSTGIILNNHMMDFNKSNQNIYKCNEIRSDKQPLSCMSPTIILDGATKAVRLIIGCAGGPKIITSISQVVLENIFCNIPLRTAIANRRLHHQLMPMVLYYEDGFADVEELVRCGHQVEMLNEQIVHDLFVPASSSVTAISVEDGQVQAYGDPRRNGVALVL